MVEHESPAALHLDQSIAENEEDATDEHPDVAYFNNAGQAPLSPEVQAVGVACVQHQPWEPQQATTSAATATATTTTTTTPTDDQTAVCQLFAQLIQAKQEDIAIMPSTSFAITLAAYNVEQTIILNNNANDSSSSISSNGRILILQDQFTSAVYPWEDLCLRYPQWSLEVVPYPDEAQQQQQQADDDGGTTTSTNWTELVLSRIRQPPSPSSNKIRVACLPPLHWSDGTLLDLTAIGQACRQHDILLVVDATQAVGAMPDLTLPKLQYGPSMLVASVHKWLRAPSGTCLVYLDAALHDTWSPLVRHGRSRTVSCADMDVQRHAMSSTTGFYPANYVTTARKFNAGGKPNGVLLPMLRASLQQVVQLDLVQFQNELQILLQPLLDWAQARDDVDVPSLDAATASKAATDTDTTTCAAPRQQHVVYHLIGLRPRHKTTEQLLQIGRQLWNDYRIAVAVRCGNLRISAYPGQTTASHVNRLIAALDELL